MQQDAPQKKVLIADDDTDLLKLYKFAFENASFLVDDALSIAKAETFLKNTKYDIIVLDIMFPDTDILPTIQKIRDSNSVNVATPILILTNLGLGAKTNKALEYGANRCMFKAAETPKSICNAASALLTNPEKSEKIQITAS